MKIKTIIIIGILYFLFGFNVGYTNENDIPLTEISFIWPIRGDLGNITMNFGQNIHPIFGQTFFHNGIDITTYRSGDPIIAAADGKVITAEYNVEFGYYILIEHNHGFHTLYAHMSNLIVQVGQNVQQGEIIGFIGSTGISTGPHLHFEIHSLFEAIDPLLYITKLTDEKQSQRADLQLLDNNIMYVNVPEGIPIYISPDINSEIIGNLNYFIEIEIIREDVNIININGIEGKMVFMITRANPFGGWIFDGYLSNIEIFINDTFNINELSIIGIWSLYDNSLYSFEFHYGRFLMGIVNLIIGDWRKEGNILTLTRDIAVFPMMIEGVQLDGDIGVFSISVINEDIIVLNLLNKNETNNQYFSDRIILKRIGKIEDSRWRLNRNNNVE